jgi:negative regulator of flagellin synthesis FlgM
MTDAINPLSRQVATDTLARKAMEKSTKAATLAPTSVGVALTPETEVAASKSAAVAKGADVAGFSAIKARLKQEPDFDRVKVDSIKHAIENGQYPLNPRRIAESFVALEQMISN